MSPELIQPTDLQFDLTRLREAVDQVLAKYPFLKSGQLNLTTREARDQSPYEMSGSLYNRNERKALHYEQEFKYFLADFEHSYLGEIYRTVNKSLGGQVGRFRLMKLSPRECYTYHKDDNIRYHLVVHTNPACFLAFEKGLFHLPADGRLYRAETRELHTALNGGFEDRLHVVVSTASVPMKF